MVEHLWRSGPTEAFLILLKKHGIKAWKGMDLPTLNLMLQKWWYRTELLKKYGDIKPDRDDLALLAELGLVNEVMVSSTDSFVGAVIPGALREGVCMRLSIAKKAIDKGVRIGQIFCLGNTRQLDAVLESEDALTRTVSCLKQKSGFIFPESLPVDECSMMELVYRQHEFPAEQEIFFCRSKNRPDDQGGLRDANFEEAAQDLLADFPVFPGRWVVCSSQPHTFLHQLQLGLQMGPEFQVAAIGLEASPSLWLADYFVVLAKTVHMLYRVREIRTTIIPGV